ncbi:hypothetical protein [Dongshaea marina]|uniref:hypothetical protein n=1 Tax=Dongshaea marina TaxID=2047966 RepID=UPI000D3E73BB|nr:hypothetical protein [Dongshaea marina]
MMDVNELLAIGSALTTVARLHIKYSVNMVSERQLLRSKRNTYMYHEKFQHLDELRKSTVQRPQKIAMALEHSVGCCGELCMICYEIADSYSFELTENLYITNLYTYHGDPESIFNHSFLLLHQSGTLNQRVVNSSLRDVPVSSSMHTLSRSYQGLDNAVIVDPWIYAATPLSELTAHILRAEELGVEECYTAGVCFNGEKEYKHTNLNKDSFNSRAIIPMDIMEGFEKEYQLHLNSLSRYKLKTKNRSIHIPRNSGSFVKKWPHDDLKYDHLLESQRLIPASESRGSFAKPRGYESIRESLFIEIDDYQRKKLNEQTRKIHEMQLFINDMINSASSCMKRFESSKKVSALIELRSCLAENIRRKPGERHKIISDDGLKLVFEAATKIALCVRGKKFKQDIPLNKLQQTKTALSLIRNDHRRYAFESIDGLSLDDFRQIRNSNEGKSEKYHRLIRHIYGGDFSIDLLQEPDHKAYWYSQAKVIYDGLKRKPRYTFAQQ